MAPLSSSSGNAAIAALQRFVGGDGAGGGSTSAALQLSTSNEDLSNIAVWAKTEALLARLGDDASPAHSPRRPPQLRQLIVPRRQRASPSPLASGGSSSSSSSEEAQKLRGILHESMQEETGRQLFNVLSELNGELQQLQQRRQEEKSASSSSSSAEVSAASGGVDDTLSYEDFCELRARVSPRLRKWLTTKVFLMLRSGEAGDGGGGGGGGGSGRIDIHVLYDLFYSVGCTIKTRLTLQGYQDPALPEGCLQEQDVERWILDLYPSITNRSAFAHDSPEFLAVYIAAASRAFFFFLDPRRQGTVQISTLVESPITDALLEVTLTAEEEGLSDSELVALSENFFSPLCVRRIFEHYSELDADECGLVSKGALRQFQGLTLDPPRALTGTFLDCLFQEVPTHSAPAAAAAGGGGGGAEGSSGPAAAAAAAAAGGGGTDTKFLDFKGFLDLTLAFEYITSTAALRYLWNVIDVQKQGYLDKFTISYFYRDIAQGLKNEGLEAPELADVVDEIFDMVRPRNGDRNVITFADLCACKVGHTVCAILVDVNAFWLYENRENLIHYDENN